MTVCSATYSRTRCAPFQTGIEGARCTLEEGHAGHHHTRIVVEFGTRPEEEVLGDFWFDEMTYSVPLSRELLRVGVDIDEPLIVRPRTPQELQELYEPFMRALCGKEKQMSVYYVNIGCYITKERPEAGFSTRETFAVRVEATSPEDAKQKVGTILSEAIAATEALAAAVKEFNKSDTAQQGDPNVG